MKITKLSLYQLGLTSHETYYMAEGKTCDTVTTSVLKIDTDEGVTGWGEVCPIPHYLPAFAGGVESVVRELSNVLIGADPVGPEALMAKCDAYLMGHIYAKSMIDIALWDITAKAANLPLYALIGGRQQDTMPLYHSITCVEPDEMVRIAQTAYQTGMRQFQVKLGADNDPLKDIERLRAVRKAVGEGPLVYGDWNMGTDKLTATRVGRAVRDLDIMLEQPCQTIEDCASVKRATGLPAKQDETAHDMESVLKAHSLECMDAMALKLSKFGGISKARAVRDLCVHLGTRLCVECTWGSDIVTAAILHLAASTPAKTIMNTCDLSHYVYPRIDEGVPTREDGRIAPPEVAGLGVTPNMDVLGDPIAVIEG
ncbi:MAG: mandelate racemase/muconate lactonizing enzyme family protein [Pseudomonadota bacterium]